MSERTLREHVAGVVAIVLGERRATEEWDSLQQIEVVLAIEDEFQVTVPEGDIPRLRSIDDVTAHLEGLRASR